MCDCVSLYDILLAASLLILLLLQLLLYLLPPLSSAHGQDSLLSVDRYAGVGKGWPK